MPYYDMMDFMMGGFPFMGFGSIFTILLSVVVAYLFIRMQRKEE
jgi:uncharacterized membrane protein